MGMRALEHEHHHARRAAEAQHDHHVASPGKSTLAQELAGAHPSAVGGEEWEDIAPHEILATPPSVDEHDADAHEEAPTAALRAEAPAPDANVQAADATTPAPGATPAPAPAPKFPTGAVGGLANEHRKSIKDYPVKKHLTVTDLAGSVRGKTDERTNATQFADGMISIDLSTVIGSRAGGYKNAYVLVWQDRAGRDQDQRKDANGKALNPDNKSADPTGWIKVGKLPKKARDDIKQFQDRDRKKRAKEGTAAGSPAKLLGTTVTVAPTNAHLITDKLVPTNGKILEPFRIAGGGIDPETGDPKSTPAGNYTHNPARYGDNIVGVWNPPGSHGAGGGKNNGSGGIRVFVPLATQLQLCDVAPIVIPNSDTSAGTGQSYWVYVTARINHQQIYFWILHHWEYTTAEAIDPQKTDRGGSNVA
jgi:hypothetical protein